jgi:Ca2+-binding RTX toxin-like protein
VSNDSFAITEGAGNDTIIAGAGDDTLRDRAGNDTFNMNANLTAVEQIDGRDREGASPQLCQIPWTLQPTGAFSPGTSTTDKHICCRVISKLIQRVEF